MCSKTVNSPSKGITYGRVVRNEQIAEAIYRIEISSPWAAEGAAPGQFVNLYPKGEHTLLPRPISLCDISEDSLTLVYGVVGAGTLEFSGYKTGDAVKLSTAQGKGFDCLNTLEKSGQRQVTLVGGGLGVPPLLALAKALIKQGDQVTAILGFRLEAFLAGDFAALGIDIHIATDNGSQGFKGTVMDYIREQKVASDYFYSCGPKPMLRELSAYCAEINVPIQVSMEERMGCGYGACLGCVCRTKEGYRKVCQDGPVFLGKDVKWDA